MAEEIADACPILGIEAHDWEKTLAHTPVPTGALAKIILVVILGAERNGVCVTGSIVAFLQQPTETTNQQLVDLENRFHGNSTTQPLGPALVHPENAETAH